MRFVSDENPNLKNYVIGNMGLVQIYSGSTEEGKETLEYVLGRVTEKQQTENVDYKFFKEELERVKKIVLPSLK